MRLPTLAQHKKGIVPPLGNHSLNGKAYLFLQQQLTGSIGTQLNILQNSVLVPK
jgi:hypothetical protein